MRFIVPEMVVTHFHLHDGDTVADLGAGSGFFIPELSRAVGERGKVYALEIQKPLVERVADLAQRAHLENVEVMWCDLEESGGIGLSDGALDGAIMANTLFQLEQKELALREAVRVLAPGGAFFLVEWSESFAGMGPAPEAVVRADTARELCESVGLHYEREFPAGEHHYGCAFRKR